MIWYPKFHELCYSSLDPDGEINCCDGVNPRSVGRFVEEDQITDILVEDNDLYLKVKKDDQEKKYFLTICDLCTANLIEKLLEKWK